MMKGTLYCIGVGPGDPELITVKALKRIQACPVLAAPQGRAGVGTAKDILLQAVAAMADVDLQGKDILNIDFPMTRDEAALAKAHADGASALEEKLAAGLDVALITLGCPTIYASSLYVQRIVEKHGYKTEIIPGVPSFCAAAARLGRPLCEKDETLTIIPGNRSDRRDLLAMDGSKVVMKPAGPLADLKQDLAAAGRLDAASMVERCGMAGEKIYTSLKDAEDGPYFSVVLVKE